MCMGIPMRVIKSGNGIALCEGQEGIRREINTQLVGDPPVGTWLLIFIDAAREIISEQEASKIGNALEALKIAMSGGTNFDHLFADLEDHETLLPEHLRTPKTKSTTKQGSN